MKSTFRPAAFQSCALSISARCVLKLQKDTKGKEKGEKSER